MDTNYIYFAVLIAIVVVVGLAVSGRLKFSLRKNRLDFETSKQKAKNKVSATNVINGSEVKIKKGDNHDITVDRIDGKSKVDIQ
jgi:hypothetical protein